MSSPPVFFLTFFLPHWKSSANCALLSVEQKIYGDVIMEIVAGTARGLILTSPGENDEVRPTSVRARRAFFDSLGDLKGKVFADIFAGSGAMGLEAASRGAEKVFFFEQALPVLKMIEKNCNRVARTGVTTDMQIVRGAIPPFRTDLARFARPDIVFADPPYAASMDFFKAVTADPCFRVWAADADLYWELPDRDYALEVPAAPWRIMAIKNFGPGRFLMLKCVDN